jgi:asparagine synthase (glutamine-hydrolysing)
MCGIAGLWDQRAELDHDSLSAIASQMADTLIHRGPDGKGVWCDAKEGVGLAHRRLAIIELSPAGAQPMVSSCGRFVISFNGEAYNFRELRRELEASGRRFRGHSDTEVILEGAAVWGVEPVVKRLIGMFAMALWDRQERTFYLVRDRLGIKPLYWARFGKRLFFGSELKALRAYTGWVPALNHNAVASVLQRVYVSGSNTIYEGVKKLMPGTMLVARLDKPLSIRAFWTLAEVAEAGQANRFTGTEDEALDQLDTVLTDAVRKQMIADVPLGAFLSGGIDSSLVVSLMQKINSGSVRSFSIGFHEPPFDEAKHAQAIARYLGLDHSELYVSPEHSLRLIPRLPDIFDEPFADPSQLPTILVSELARQHVTVALSGDGGDELFAGYNRYFQVRRLVGMLKTLPPGSAKLIAAIIQSVPITLWNSLGACLPGFSAQSQLGDRLFKLATVLPAQAPDIYSLFNNHWRDSPPLVIDAASAAEWPDSSEYLDQLIPDSIERMQYIDTMNYLPDDILTKVDRASMALSLEARVPLLDHRVVAFSWTLPPKWKAHGKIGKYLLRRLLDRYVPRALVDRPKKGFGVPIDTWLRGPLREWAEDLLDETRLKREGILDAMLIRQKWEEHLTGARNWQYLLWGVVMFQAWKARWLPT